MGCGSSSGQKFENLSSQSSEVFNELIQEYNNFLLSSSQIHAWLSEAYKYADSALSIFSINFSNNISDQIPVKYIELILHVYKSISLGVDQSKYNFYFMNYLPGIAIQSKENRELTLVGNIDIGLDSRIENNLKALDRLCEQIFKFVRDFPQKNEEIIRTVVELRDEYPKRFYEAAKRTSGVMIINEFALIEKTLISNFQTFGDMALRFDKFFYDTKAILIKIQATIDVCANDFGYFKKYFSVIET